MAAPMKCPLCANPLEPVGKKGKKMRCDNCRSVFDVPQLHAYYGIGASGLPPSSVHDYETAHMHAMEVQRQAQQGASQAAAPSQQPQPVQTPLLGGKQQKAPVATNEKPQQSPVKKGGSPVIRVIFWIVVVFVIASPLLGGIISALEDAFFDEGGIVQQLDSKSASVPSAGSTRGTTGTGSTGTDTTGATGIGATGATGTGSTGASGASGIAGKGSVSVSGYQAIGPSMNLSATAWLAKDDSGTDVLIVEYQWTNAEDYATEFSVAVRTSAKQDDVTMTGAYPKGSISGYDGNLRYSRVEKGQTGTAMEVFTLVKGNASGLVVVTAKAWSDDLSMDDPPTFTWEFDLDSL